MLDSFLNLINYYTINNLYLNQVVFTLNMLAINPSCVSNSFNKYK